MSALEDPVVGDPKESLSARLEGFAPWSKPIFLLDEIESIGFIAQATFFSFSGNEQSLNRLVEKPC